MAPEVCFIVVPCRREGVGDAKRQCPDKGRRAANQPCADSDRARRRQRSRRHLFPAQCLPVPTHRGRMQHAWPHAPCRGRDTEAPSATDRSRWRLINVALVEGPSKRAPRHHPTFCISGKPPRSVMENNNTAEAQNTSEPAAKKGRRGKREAGSEDSKKRRCISSACVPCRKRKSKVC